MGKRGEGLEEGFRWKGKEARWTESGSSGLVLDGVA